MIAIPPVDGEGPHSSGLCGHMKRDNPLLHGVFCVLQVTVILFILPNSSKVSQ